MEKTTKSIDDYTEFFKSVEQLCLDCNIKEKMKDNNIIIVDEYRQSIKLFNVERGGAVANYRVHISRFVMNIKMLVVESATPRHQEHNIINRGGFGVILELPTKRQNVVGKRINLSCYLDSSAEVQKFGYFPFELKQALMEYSILKICSALGIAPMLYNEIGFDVVRFPKHLEFYMQMCQPLQNSIDNISKLQQRMKYCVRLMHSFKIVHRDIKPQNMLYSYYFKNHVICDFGTSIHIKEQLGSSTLTEYIGTARYISQQMRRCQQKGSGYVDLYFNDFYGLSISLNLIKARSTKPTNSRMSSGRNVPGFLQLLQQAYDMYKGGQPQKVIQNGYTAGLVKFFPEMQGKPLPTNQPLSMQYLLRCVLNSLDWNCHVERCLTKDKSQLLQIIQQAIFNNKDGRVCKINKFSKDQLAIKFQIDELKMKKYLVQDDRIKLAYLSLDIYFMNIMQKENYQDFLQNVPRKHFIGDFTIVDICSKDTMGCDQLKNKLDGVETCRPRAIQALINWLDYYEKPSVAEDFIERIMQNNKNNKEYVGLCCHVIEYKKKFKKDNQIYEYIESLWTKFKHFSTVKAYEDLTRYLLQAKTLINQEHAVDFCKNQLKQRPQKVHYIYCHYLQNYSRKFRMFHESQNYSKQAMEIIYQFEGETQTYIEAMVEYAATFSRVNEQNQCLVMLARAQQILHGLCADNDYRLVKVRVCRADCLICKGQLEEAAAILRLAIEQIDSDPALETSLEIQKVRKHCLLRMACLIQRQPTEVEPDFLVKFDNLVEKTLQIQSRFKVSLECTQLCVLLLRRFSILHMFPEAKKHYERLRNWIKYIDNQDYMCSILQDFVVYYQQLGQLSKASTCFEELLNIQFSKSTEKLHRKTEISHLIYVINAAFTIGQASRAEKFISRLVQLSPFLYSNVQFSSFYNIARNLLEWQRYPMALKIFNLHYKLTKEIESLYEVAGCHYQMKDYEMAVAIGKDVLKRVQVSNDKTLILFVKTKLLLSKCYQKLGQSVLSQEEHESAAQRIREVYPIIIKNMEVFRLFIGCHIFNKQKYKRLIKQGVFTMLQQKRLNFKIACLLIHDKELKTSQKTYLQMMALCRYAERITFMWRYLILLLDKHKIRQFCRNYKQLEKVMQQKLRKYILQTAKQKKKGYHTSLLAFFKNTTTSKNQVLKDSLRQTIRNKRIHRVSLYFG